MKAALISCVSYCGVNGAVLKLDVLSVAGGCDAKGNRAIVAQIERAMSTAMSRSSNKGNEKAQRL